MVGGVTLKEEKKSVFTAWVARGWAGICNERTEGEINTERE